MYNSLSSFTYHLGAVMIRLLLVLLFSMSSASAAELRIIVPSNNDGYNVNARILARHYDKFLNQNTNIIVQAMPGAAGMIAANFIYSIAPNDGSVIATVQKNVVIESIRSGKIYPSRFTWIGSTADGRKDAVFIWSNKPNDIMHFRNNELILTRNSTTNDDLNLIKNSLNIMIKPITGYSSGGEIRLAVDRGEVDAAIFSLIGIKTTKPEWLKPDSRVIPILQYGNGRNRHPEFPNVPTLTELVTDQKLLAIIEAHEKQYTLLRPFIAPPNIPSNRAEELRNAFFKTIHDEEYLRDMKAANIEVNPVFWDEAERIVQETMRFYER
jgi:tripartite-type tricarboxylate transporter receptor subunit TctC